MRLREAAVAENEWLRLGLKTAGAMLVVILLVKAGLYFLPGYGLLFLAIETILALPLGWLGDSFFVTMEMEIRMSKPTGAAAIIVFYTIVIVGLRFVFVQIRRRIT